MPDLNLTTLILLALLVGAVIFIGRELEERYPEYVDYAHPRKSTVVQQLRAGTFVALDYASELAFPGSREKALEYKRNRARASLVVHSPATD